jgi:exoribonuclease-2
MNGNKIDLSEIARIAMEERGLLTDFPSAVLKEVSSMQSSAKPGINTHDMREQPWISIDNDDSKDLDQITFAEETVAGEYRIYIAIADVDALVKKDSAIDRYAAHNTTSVYTPTRVFSMLPLRLSTDLTSLNEHEDRCAIITEVRVGSDGSFDLANVYAGWVRNHAKLTYNGVSAWLEEKTPLPNALTNVQEVFQQLELQDRIAQKIKAYRIKQGALTFASLEVRAVVVDGIPVGLQEKAMNRGDELIENFMIAANVAVTHFLMRNHMPAIRRIVKVPKRWDRIVELASTLGTKLPEQPNAIALRDFLMEQERSRPEHFGELSLAMIKLIGRGEYVLSVPGGPKIGHFDLALRDYAHTTAPNRRFPDLITQRMVKCCLEKTKPAYRNDELAHLAQRCTEKEDDATKVERRVHKSAAAMILAPKLGQQFSAMITGINEDGTWIRLKTLPVEGKLVAGYQGMDVGDKLSVRLVHVDIFNGHIDFARF